MVALLKSQYPKNIMFVKMLIRQGVPASDAFKVCQYTEKQAGKLAKQVEADINIMELNRRLEATDVYGVGDTDVVVNISVD